MKRTDMSRSDAFLLGIAKPMRETPHALLVQITKSDGTGLVDGAIEWIPKSCIHDDSECHELKSGPGKIYVPEWFAEEKGWS